LFHFTLHFVKLALDLIFCAGFHSISLVVELSATY
jgi:hypothetical protein